MNDSARIGRTVGELRKAGNRPAWKYLHRRYFAHLETSSLTDQEKQENRKSFRAAKWKSMRL